MKRRIESTDIHTVLEGFVLAGLIRKILVPKPSRHAFNPSFDPSSLNNKRSRFSKRECILIKAVIREFCSRFVRGATVVYIGDTGDKSEYLQVDYLAKLGVKIDAATKMPDIVVHDTERNRLLLIEAVTSAGPVDGKRRKELKELFAGCKAGLVFVTAFETRRVMQSFVSQIAWESEVWIAEDPDHMIHFNGERFLGPYPDVMPK